MKYRTVGAPLAIAAACFPVIAAEAAEPVTVDNHVRAETDMTMKRYCQSITAARQSTK